MSNFSEKLGQFNGQKGQKRPPTYIKDHFQRKLGQYYVEYRAKRKVQKTLMSKLNENKVSVMDRKDRNDLVHVLDPRIGVVGTILGTKANMDFWKVH